MYEPLVSSLFAGDCLVHRLRKDWSDEQVIDQLPAHLTSPFLTGAQDSHLQRVTIIEAVYIKLRL